MDRFNNNEDQKTISQLSPAENYLNGVFYFSNWTEEPFEVWWNSIKYTFPPNCASPMVIMGEPPEGVQNIRKMFAEKLANREIDKLKEYREMAKKGGAYPAIAGVANILNPLIQKCLIPLPMETAEVKPETPLERKGQTIKATRPVQKGEKAKKIMDADDPTPQEVGKL